MKQIIITLTLLTVLNIKSSGQNCDITNHYEDFIKIEKESYKEREYLRKIVIELDEKSCFKNLINNNISLVDYFLTHFTSTYNRQRLLQISDSLKLNRSYIKYLKNDSLFNATMVEFVDKTVDKTTPKDTITIDELLNIAVKYFSILRITEEGYYAGKVCVGANDIKETEKERKPFIEAFCFSSIQKHYRSKEYRLNEEFKKSLKQLYKVNLGVDKDEKLLRAQGAMFFLMRNNENLKRMLLSEYEKNEDYLPFVLKEE